MKTDPGKKNSLKIVVDKLPELTAEAPVLQITLLFLPALAEAGTAAAKEGMVTGVAWSGELPLGGV
jgi:hypothetical protein